MIRRLAFVGLVIGAVLLGLSARAGSHLLALTSPTARAEIASDPGTPFAGEGLHAVGLRDISDEARTAVTVWYPAARANGPSSTASYAYAINMLDPETSIALASYGGRAIPDAAADASGGPYPLVVFSSGFAITPRSYGWLAEHLASRGFVVAAPRHRESLDPGTLWEATIQRPVDVAVLMTRVEEMSRPGGEFEELVDLDRVGIVGHSYGGYTAQVAGGARLDTGALEKTCETARVTDDPVTFLCDALQPRLEAMASLADLPAVPNGMWPDWSDSRIDAVVSMAGDAVMFGADGLSGVETPVLAIGATADTDSPFQWGTGYTYDHVSSSRKIEVGLKGAGHMIFAGKCERTRRILALVPMGFCSDPAWERDHAHQVVSHYVTAFLVAELIGDQMAEDGLAPDHQNVPDVSYRSEGY